MALVNIINKILEDADARARAISEDASSKIREISGKMMEEGDALKKRILDEAEARSGMEKARAYSSKNLEIRKELLRKKRELMDSAFEGAFTAALNLDDARYVAAIERMITADISAGEEVEIRFSKNDEKKIKKDLIENLNKAKNLKLLLGPYLAVNDRGFIIKKDKVIIDSTFSKGLDALKGKIQFQVAKILFG